MSCLQDKWNNDDILQMITNGIYILHVWVIPHILEMRDVFYVMHAKVWWGFNLYHIFVNEL